MATVRQFSNGLLDNGPNAPRLDARWQHVQADWIIVIKKFFGAKL
jgi:hypothetical protein